MPNITLSIPEDLKKEMEQFPEINWSVLARQAIVERLRELIFIKKFKAKSTFTEEDAIRLGREVNKAMHKRYEGLRKKENETRSRR